MQSEYVALVAYAGVTFTVFVFGLLWYRYRAWLKHKLNLEDYQRTDHSHGHSHG